LRTFLAEDAMPSLMLILLVVVVAAAFYGLTRLASSTAREVVISFGPGEPSGEEVKAALERMGCLVSGDRGRVITGFLSGSGGSWGQEVTVTIDPGRLRVRSCFSNSQVFGARKNQENVDRFRAEWDRRDEFRVAAGDTAVLASTEMRAREVAGDALLGGALAVIAGLALLLIAAFVPSREGASPGGKLRLVGLAMIPLAYGVLAYAPRSPAFGRRERDDRPTCPDTGDR
jgi:hypothetical protein